LRHEIGKICENLQHFSDTFLLSGMCYTVVFRGLYSDFMLQKLQTPESDTLVFRKYDLFQYFFAK